MSRPTMQTRRKINFIEDDERELNRSHDDALIITADINDSKVARILINIWSAVDLIFSNTLKRMGVEGVQGSLELISGFTGETTMTLVTISLIVSVTGGLRVIEFVVVDSPST